MGIGNNIRNIRKEKKMTLKQVADIMGCSPQLISQYESGKRNPKPETLIRITKALKCKPEDLLSHDKKTSQEMANRVNDYLEHMMKDSDNDPFLAEEAMETLTVFTKLIGIEEPTTQKVENVLSELIQNNSGNVLQHIKNLCKIILETVEFENTSE